jgi:hypothetical protein
LVYDNGSNLAVVAVKPDVNLSEIDATLRQASNDLFAYGRIGKGDDRFTVRLRVINHLEPGVSEPLYLGQVRRELIRDDADLDIQIYQENFKKLASSQSIS